LPEFDRIKALYKTQLVRPVDTKMFWKSVISRKADLPHMHVILRMALALTPSNAVVEQAFSRLTKLLSPQRLSLDTSNVTMLMVVALDSAPWDEYDVSQVADFMKNHRTRTAFRHPRNDKGGKHRKRQRREQTQALIPGGAQGAPADQSDDDSSDSDESGFSEADVL
jgi:hypothetical protein